MAAGPQEANIGVGRKVSPGQVADVETAVGVGERGGYEKPIRLAAGIGLLLAGHQ